MLGIAVALMAPLASLGLASVALAKEPAGDFSVFKQCPRFTPGLTSCLNTQVASGEYVLGHLTIPITNPITLQGGVSINQETGAETFVYALNGETLPSAPEPVPGGLLGILSSSHLPRPLGKIIDRFEKRHLLDLTATPELAQPENGIGINESNLINQEGATLTLPLKFKLDNPLLGDRCYIGSRSDPVVLNLTDGETHPPAPNTPIKGKIGEIEFKDEFTFIAIKNSTLVDNAFAVPKARGCGGFFSFLVDHLIDAQLALPSPAGNNTAIQNGMLSVATTEAVIASEK